MLINKGKKERTQFLILDSKFKRLKWYWIIWTTTTKNCPDQFRKTRNVANDFHCFINASIQFFPERFFQRTKNRMNNVKCEAITTKNQILNCFDIAFDWAFFFFGRISNSIIDPLFCGFGKKRTTAECLEWVQLARRHAVWYQLQAGNTCFQLGVMQFVLLSINKWKMTIILQWLQWS